MLRYIIPKPVEIVGIFRLNNGTFLSNRDNTTVQEFAFAHVNKVLNFKVYFKLCNGTVDTNKLS